MPDALQQLSPRCYIRRLLTVRAGFLCQHAGHNVQGQSPHKLAHIHFESWRSVCARYCSDQSVSLHQAPEGGRVNVCQAFHASEHIQQLHRHSYHSKVIRELSLINIELLRSPFAEMGALSVSKFGSQGLGGKQIRQSPPMGVTPQIVGKDSKGGGITYPLMSAHSLLV